MIGIRSCDFMCFYHSFGFCIFAQSSNYIDENWKQSVCSKSNGHQLIAISLDYITLAPFCFQRLHENDLGRQVNLSLCIQHVPGKQRQKKCGEMHVFILSFLWLAAIPNDHFQIVNYLKRQIM